MQRIRTGDEVVVIAGKNKGSHGKVLEINPEKTAWSSRA
jgi:ribosomal protein L24